MAVTGIKSAKVTMYKMVSIPTTSGTKEPGGKVSVNSYKAFTTGLNRIGASINSTIVVNRQIKDVLLQNLKLKDKEFDEEKKRFQKEKEDKNKAVKKGGGFPSLGIGKVVAGVAGGFLSALATLGGTLLKFVISQSILRWMANPENIKKLTNIVGAIIKVVTFLSSFLRDNIVKMMDGLATMLDGKKNIFEKLGGFVTFFAGFGAILGAALILKKPGLVLKGVVWVLKSLFVNLTKTKASLVKVAASSASGGGGFGAWSKDQGAKAGAARSGGGGGRFGALAKGVAATAAIAVPIVVGASMAGGPDEFSSESGSVSSGGSTPPQKSSGGVVPTAKPEDKDARLALGGIATRPTSAVIGEAGPELRMPIDNAQRMKDSGIKPLSSLGGMFGGKNQQSRGDSKQAKQFSDLLMTPFRGVGAGILANVSSVVSGSGPAAKVLTPILDNIITPIANSFGVPPSLVKKLTSKGTSSAKESTKVKGKGDNLKKLFGRGVAVKEDSKKFKRVGDTSVLGLLSNIVAAVQVVGNKVGGSGGGGGSSGASPAASDAAITSTPGATGGGSSGEATNTATDTLKKANALKEDGTLQGVKGISKTTGSGRGARTENSPGGGLLPVTGGNREYWYNTSGDIFRWKKPGDPLTDITSAGDKQAFDVKTLGGSLVRDLKNGEVKIIKAQGLFGMAGGDQTPVGYYNYQANGILKESAKPGPKGTGPKDKWEQPKDGKYGPTITPKAEPAKKANGGWINGPQSGYPVSLDGGGSTSFIGHGTEWVGFKKAAQGGAFVVPFDTPATKNNPGLTASRMTQAKSGGYALPTRSMGGKVDTKKKGSGDEGLKTKTTGGAVITSKYGPRWGRLHAGTDLAGVPTGTPIKSLTGGKVLYASTYGGYGNTVDLQVSPGKVFRFAHLDGFGVKSGQTISAGDIIGTLGNTGVGTGPHLHFEHRKKPDFGAGTSMDPETTGALSEIAIGGKPISGITPGKDGESPAGSTTPDGKTSPEEPPETLEGLMTTLRSAVSGLNASLGYAPPETSVDSASKNADKAKDDKAKAAKEQTQKATAASMKSISDTTKSKSVMNVPTASKPVMMPGPSSIIPIEIAFAPTTSLYQPKIGSFR